MESVRGPGTDAGAPASWRLRVARRVEAAYGPSPSLAVVAAAGSVGAGFADRWSDLEELDLDPVKHYRLAAVAQGVFGAVLAVNRVFRPHRLPKWQRQLLGGLPLTPDRLGPRMEELWDPAPLVALSAAERLVHDTIEWAERASGLELGGVRVELAERRRPVDPPSVP